MNINKAMELKAGQYFAELHVKKNIVIHHTVSSTAKSALTWWASQVERIATAYVIDKDGTVYQAFPEMFWAHHLGLKTSDNGRRNRQSIGIELVNEGLLAGKPGELHWLGEKGPIYKGQSLELSWRGGRHWPLYTPEQMAALHELVVAILGRHKGIEPTVAPLGVFDAATPDKYGIYFHHNVRTDKTDVSPAFDRDGLLQLVNPESYAKEQSSRAKPGPVEPVGDAPAEGVPGA